MKITLSGAIVAEVAQNGNAPGLPPRGLHIPPPAMQNPTFRDPPSKDALLK
jgi:hypothetical protein